MSYLGHVGDMLHMFSKLQSSILKEIHSALYIIHKLHELQTK